MQFAGNRQRRINPLMGTSNCRATDYYRAIRWLVHWPLMGGLLHLVQQGQAWAGCRPSPVPSSLYQM